MRVEWTDRLAATSKKEWTTIEQGKQRMGVHHVVIFVITSICKTFEG